jgi:hypothetical protein
MLVLAVQTEPTQLESFSPTVRTRSPSNIHHMAPVSESNILFTNKSGKPKSIPAMEISAQSSHSLRKITCPTVQEVQKPHITSSKSNFQKPCVTSSNSHSQDLLADRNDDSDSLNCIQAAERGYDRSTDDFTTLFDKLGL